MYTQKQLIATLKRCAREIGKSPTQSEYERWRLWKMGKGRKSDIVKRL